ncbi:cupin domain-containing protein [Pseudomonas sp. N40(2020)]|uniref:cupin domain-containing protein n=1 Tax=Pseudomonas sp. N40(2020) TaxID=2767798 RepID=UPI001656FD0B|nr:cupin domain-containing protein [Pseudomonas sp. N40(2020)]MBC8999417.1 cupin domain-containing protein [Pseudomonas sp. N40(2020)]
MTQRKTTIKDVIAALDLAPHVEGGYFRRTYQADHRDMLQSANGTRYLMTSIYYLLTEQSPVGQFHFNQSDILHYLHLGDAIEYSLIRADGSLQTLVMGSDVLAGQHLQLHVPGGIWKASRLLDGSSGFGLISEAVSPGFDFADMEMGNRQKLTAQFPQHRTLIEKLTREDD